MPNNIITFLDSAAHHKELHHNNVSCFTVSYTGQVVNNGMGVSILDGKTLLKVFQYMDSPLG